MLNSFYKHKFQYENIVKYEIIAKYPIKNVMEIPKFEKICLNFGFIKTLANKKQPIPGLLALELLSKQKPYLTRSKKQLYSYKIRKNMIVGAAVTLRKKKMYYFLENLLTNAIPNYQNFVGFPIEINQNKRSITFCLEDLSIFPEFEFREYSSTVRVPICKMLKVCEIHVAV